MVQPGTDVLSVSTSQTTSSTATASPTAFSKRMSPSEMDSANAGQVTVWFSSLTDVKLKLRTPLLTKACGRGKPRQLGLSDVLTFKTLPCITMSGFFFDRFQKTQGRKNSRLKKTQGHFSAKNLTFRRFLRLQPKNSKEKIVHRKIFIWVDAQNVIFMDMFVDFCNIYTLLCAC